MPSTSAAVTGTSDAVLSNLIAVPVPSTEVPETSAVFKKAISGKGMIQLLEEKRKGRK